MRCAVPSDIEALRAARDQAQGEAGFVELLLVDNGSRDDSAAIAHRHEDLTVLREERPGA